MSWNELKPMVISHLNHYFENNNEPILKENKKREPNQNDDETVKKIIDVLDTKIRPAVARDGGDIKFKCFVDGVVKVELQMAAPAAQVHNDFKTRSSKSP